MLNQRVLRAVRVPGTDSTQKSFSYILERTEDNCLKGGEHEVCDVIQLMENTEMVDGLGGANWDGSLLLCNVLQKWLTPRSGPKERDTPFESSSSALAVSSSSVNAYNRDKMTPPHIVELGCGSGMLGLVLNRLNPHVNITCTDREIDLVEENISRHITNVPRTLALSDMHVSSACDTGTSGAAGAGSSGNSRSKKEEEIAKYILDAVKTLSHLRKRNDSHAKEAGDVRESSQPKKFRLQEGTSAAKDGKFMSMDTPGTTWGEKKDKETKLPRGYVRARELQWGSKGGVQCDFLLSSPKTANSIINGSVSTAMNTGKYPDLVVGAEIAVLSKQQEALVDTIDRLTGPRTLVLLTCDEEPTLSPTPSKYEDSLDARMARMGFLKAVVAVGRVQWKRVSKDDTSEVAYFTDLTPHFSCSNSAKGVRQLRHAIQADKEEREVSETYKKENKRGTIEYQDKPYQGNKSAEGKEEKIQNLVVDVDMSLDKTPNAADNSQAKQSYKESLEHISELSNALFGLNIAPSPNLPTEYVVWGDILFEKFEVILIIMSMRPQTSNARLYSYHHTYNDLQSPLSSCTTAMLLRAIVERPSLLIHSVENKCLPPQPPLSTDISFSTSSSSARNPASDGSSSRDDSKKPRAHEGLGDVQEIHHVNAYFRPSLLSTCCRCKKQFWNNPVLFSNPNSKLFSLDMQGCRYHPQYYVCRFHPAEMNLDLGTGNADGLGYYASEGDDKGYEAKFWDCCSSEDEHAQGCCTGVHITY